MLSIAMSHEASSEPPPLMLQWYVTTRHSAVLAAHFDREQTHDDSTNLRTHLQHFASKCSAVEIDVFLGEHCIHGAHRGRDRKKLISFPRYAPGAAGNGQCACSQCGSCVACLCQEQCVCVCDTSKADLVLASAGHTRFCGIQAATQDAVPKIRHRCSGS